MQIGDTFRGIPSAYSSRSVRFPVRISVPMERVFKGEEAEIQKPTGVRESSTQEEHRETAGGGGGLWEKPGSLRKEIRRFYTRKLELQAGTKAILLDLP